MRRHASYMLVLVHQLEPLRDATGKPFAWLPCMSQPLCWDEAAPANIRRRAAEICLTECPALIPCTARREELVAAAEQKRGQPPRGVWAGKMMSGRGDAEEVELWAITGSANPARSLTRRRLPPLPADTYRLI